MLRLGEDLAYSFLGALISVARIDGAISIDESRVLREIADELDGGDDFDFEFALTMNKSVTEFARELTDQGSPFRGGGANTSNANAAQVGDAFVEAARRVAAADDGSSDAEERLIRAFIDQLKLG